MTDQQRGIHIEYIPSMFADEKYKQIREEEETITVENDVNDNTAATAPAAVITCTASVAVAKNQNPQQRKLIIWSWGKNVHENLNCDLTIDLVSFRSEFEYRDIRKADGRDSEIQQLMESHPDYLSLMGLIVELVDNDEKIQSVGFVCSWGKHRSMAFAELLKRDFYPRSRLKHARIIKQFEDDEQATQRRKKKKKESKMKRNRRQPRF